MLGPVPGSIQQRREAITGSAGGPLSYDKAAREVTATLSKGSPVQRLYGVESLEISKRAIDLTRLEQGGIPLLDHHKQDGIDSILGRVTDAWISNGALLGQLKFADTKRGRTAEGMVARGELGAVSVGYRVSDWRVTDADGDVVDEKSVRWNDDLTFTATRWQLFEVSLVGVPADGAAQVRAMPIHHPIIANILARMQCRQRMVERMLRRRHA
jgi:HK97 family phage prohead protease